MLHSVHKTSVAFVTLSDSVPHFSFCSCIFGVFEILEFNIISLIIILHCPEIIALYWASGVFYLKQLVTIDICDHHICNNILLYFSHHPTPRFF